MTVNLRSAVVPAYVLLCIVLGGSVQGIWGNMVLQLLGIGVIAWCLITADIVGLPKAASSLFLLAGATVALLAMQIIPLPPALWQALPGREVVAEGFTLLGQQVPWLSLSLSPYETIAASMTLIPPAAVLTGMVLSRAYRPSWLVIAILAGTLAAILLGALQVSSGSPTQSPWYLYHRTNHGSATGFFANSNHMATLLVVSLALLAAFVAALRASAKNEKSASAVMLLAVAGVVTLVVGIALNGSLAALLLGLPVAIFSLALCLPQRRRRLPVLGLGLASAAAVAVLYMSPLHDRLIAPNAASFESREKFWANSVPAIGDHWMLGSGVGSFPNIYPRYEDHTIVSRTFVNHAHNDYLEVALETGVPGVLLMIAFILWWIGRASTVWRSPAADRYAQAAVIASAAILTHSLVDYPLRTAAMSSVFAACLALMIQPRPRDPDLPEDLWPTRHLTA